MNLYLSHEAVDQLNKRGDIMNKFLLAGEVVSIGDEYMVMETVERTPSGDYPDEHDVYFDGEMPVVSVGEKIQVLGKIGKDPDDPRKLRLTAEVDNVRDYDGALDLNIAKVSGKLHRGFEYFPPAEGKRAFGNLLIVVGNEFYIRGVVLTASACIEMKRSEQFMSGAEIELSGRLQTRPFEINRNGVSEERVALEIVVDADKTKVLKKASDYDPFAEFEKQTAEAI